MARHHHTHDTFYHVYYEKPIVLLDAYGNDFGGRYVIVTAYDETAAARKARKKYKNKFGKIIKIVEKWRDSGEYKKNPRHKKSHYRVRKNFKKYSKLHHNAKRRRARRGKR